MTFLKKLAPLAALASLLMPSLALADQDVRSCCILLENSSVTSCYQFTDPVQSDDPNAPELTTVRQHQRYKCENIPYLYTDRAGETARYVANDTNNSGVCGTALSTTCNSQSGITIPRNTVHAKCQAPADCGSSSVYVCESNYCKIKESQGCVGTEGTAVNCANGLVCRTTPNGRKCLTADADVSGIAEDVSRTTEEDIASPFVPVVPKLSIPIPGFQFTSATEIEGEVHVPYLAQYINAIYRYMTAIVLTVAIVMIVYGGFKYLLASTPLGVKDGKTIITDSIIGMTLVLGAYVILNTVNPALLTLETLKLDYIEPKQFEYIPDDVYTAITAGSTYRQSGIPGSTAAARTEAEALGRTVAREQGVDECYIVATIRHESGGNVNAIAHDENVTRVSTRARGYFLRLGTTYLGAPVTANTRNDDAFDPSKPDFGLDMRMGHGFGIGQITFGQAMSRPAGRGTTQCTKNGQLVYGKELGGTCYSIPDLLTMEGGIRAMVAISKQKLAAANGEVPAAMAMYIGYWRSRTDDPSQAWRTDFRTVNRMNTYNACRGGR